MSIVNLLPDDFLRNKRQRRANVLCLVLFGIVMAGVIAAMMVSERATQNNIAVRDRVDQQYAQAAQKIQRMQQLQAQKQTMIKKAEQTATLMEKVPRSYLLAMVTNAMPEEAGIKNFNLITKQIVAAPTPAQPTKFAAVSGTPAASAQSTAPRHEVLMEIRGLARTDVQVAQFIAKLYRNPLIASVDLAYSKEVTLGKDDPPVREFEVRTRLKSNADVLEALEKDKQTAKANQQEPTSETGA
ncbi:MAG: PilN domain-containing protein [Phycisphaerae bacterium]